MMSYKSSFTSVSTTSATIKIEVSSLGYSSSYMGYINYLMFSVIVITEVNSQIELLSFETNDLMKVTSSNNNYEVTVTPSRFNITANLPHMVHMI